MSAFINPFVNVFNLQDNAQLELAGAQGIASIQLGGTTYVYVAGTSDAGVAVFTMNVDGSLVQLGDLEDNTGSASSIAGVVKLETVTIGGNPFLVATAGTDDAISVFAIDPGTGQLTETEAITNNATRLLDNAFGLDITSVGGKTFALVTGFNDDGLSVFEIDSSGQMIERDSIGDDNSRSLNGALHVATARVGNAELVFVSGQFDNGVTVFRLRADGSLEQRFNLSDSPTTNLSSPRGLNTIEIDGTTFLVVAGQSNGLSTFSVASDGTLTNVDNLQTNIANTLADVQIKTIGGINIVMATSSGSWDVIAYELKSDGTLEVITSVDYLDDPALLIRSPRNSEFVTIGDREYVIVTGTSSNGLSVFEVGAAEDVFVGTSGDDIMAGLDADDELLGRDGRDTLDGGNGDDILSGGGSGDLLIGGAGADVIIGAGGIDTASYESASSGITVDLFTGIGSRGDANGDVLVKVENLLGSNFGDVINGSGGRNFLSGLDGNDTINGGTANDRVAGGVGNDTLNGDGGADIVNGGSGNDVVNGNNGNDTLLGGAGRDDMNGGNGDDIMSGEGGTDTFIFDDGFGVDTITDFEDGTEVIDLSNVSAVSSFTDLFVAQQGSDVIIFVTGQDSITLENELRANIDASDFVF